MDQVTVLSPATVSNVVCGFDCLGFALQEPCDELTLRKTVRPGITIVHHDEFGLPRQPEKNVAGVALRAFIEAASIRHGYEMEITKRIKPGSGIGSSAASACGAVVAANFLAGEPFSRTELVELAMAGEVVASGSWHADNLAPCIFGGFTLVRSTEPLDIVPLDLPELFAAVIHPQIEVRTAEARALLPKEVLLAEAVRNWSNLGAFVAALHASDRELLSRSMVDTIVEPARSSLIPRFDEVRKACLDAGAIGGGISGSGPSMFMLCGDRPTAERVGEAMENVYSSTGIPFHIYVSPVSPQGVRLAS